MQTRPSSKIVFNAPYDDKHTYHVKMINSAGIKTTNMKRLGVEGKEDVLLAVPCDAFAFGQEETNNDRLIVEWTKTPEAAKKRRREWF